MVQLMRSGNLRPGTETTSLPEKHLAKLEIEDSLEEEHGPLNKRVKSSSPFVEKSTGSNEFPIPPTQYNPLDEPSPLGLRLRKSPSLLDLIQMRLSQGNASSLDTEPTGNLDLRGKEDVKGTTASMTADKLKASNFPASLLRIGRWEYLSRYEGDLVAKCYFAKHKLVWEILDGGLKSKIEIQWSDIMALKANCPDDGPGTLIVVLARQPLFFRETNPQPRKHTLWQGTADFTDGEASIHRQHFLQCPQGLLNKHYEKLIQCDVRLNLLSRQPEIALDSLYFEARGSVFEDPDESKVCGFNQPETSKGSPISSFQDGASLSTVTPTAQSFSSKIQQQDSLGKASEHPSQEAPSPSSVMDLRAIEGTGSHGGDGFKGPRNWEQIKVPGIRPSMSMSDLVNHIGHHISEQMTSGNPPSEKALECQDMLENIAQILLGDTQFTAASDEKSLMARVNSLCCLLQDPATVPNSEVDRESCFEGLDEKSLMSRVNSLRCLLQDPATIPNSQANGGSHFEGFDDEEDVQFNHTSDSVHKDKAEEDVGAPGRDSKDVFGCRQSPAMSRKDSFGELLLSLPRIASLPKFLFDIAEDSGESG
uniref:TRF2/HOY1 PH-like domain-containing protein n=1 Tax=Davidia involucrata TaxID=16924 RepID=A0A5B7BLI1_DAVIN